MTGYYEKEVIHIHGKNATKNGVTEVERAKQIKRTLGVYTAARYLAKRQWSVEAAMFVLLGV